VLAKWRNKSNLQVSVEEKVPASEEKQREGMATQKFIAAQGDPIKINARSRLRRIGVRTPEIQRLIGRALRSFVNLDIIGNGLSGRL
jgi:ribonuclease PH